MIKYPIVKKLLLWLTITRNFEVTEVWGRSNNADLETAAGGDARSNVRATDAERDLISCSARRGQSHVGAREAEVTGTVAPVGFSSPLPPCCRAHHHTC